MMKEKIILSCFSLVLFFACSSSKSVNKGKDSNTMNQSNTTQNTPVSRPVKMAEGVNKPTEQKNTELKSSKPSVHPKTETSSSKTYEAAPSVPDTL